MGESAMNSRTREQGDQGEEQGGENRDPALRVKSQHNRSRPNHPRKTIHLYQCFSLRCAAASWPAATQAPDEEHRPPNQHASQEVVGKN